MKNLLLKGSAVAGAAMPMLAFAQADASSVLGVIGNLINQAIPILISAAVLWFIIGIIRFVIAGDADKKADARRTVIQGLIGLFIIVSMWGIVFFIGNTFGVGSVGVDTTTIAPIIVN